MLLLSATLVSKKAVQMQQVASSTTAYSGAKQDSTQAKGDSRLQVAKVKQIGFTTNPAGESPAGENPCVRLRRLLKSPESQDVAPTWLQDFQKSA